MGAQNPRTTGTMLITARTTGTALITKLPVKKNMCYCSVVWSNRQCVFNWVFDIFSSTPDGKNLTPNERSLA